MAFNFQRVTTSKSFIPQIDGLRFVAILSVVLFHLHASLNHNGAVVSPFAGSMKLMETLSKRGVELFFVISGFILAMPFAKARLYGTTAVTLKSYFVRRLTRLEPPYLLNLAICSVAMVMAGKLQFSEVSSHFLPTLLYAHQAIFGTYTPINPVAWSLEVEVQFYILVPLLTAVFLIRSATVRRLFLASAILTWSLATVNLEHFGRLHYITIAASHFGIIYYLAFFISGLLTCDIYLGHSREWSKGPKSYAWDLIGLAGWPLVWLLEKSVAHVVLPFVIAILYITVFRGRLSSKLFSKPWITHIGGMCYTIYLFHYVIISLSGKVFKWLYFGGGFAGYFVLQALLILPIILLFCGGYFLLIERPCMDKNWPTKLVTFVFRRRSEEQTVHVPLALIDRERVPIGTGRPPAS